jgi:hypothetical protein
MPAPNMRFYEKGITKGIRTSLENFAQQGNIEVFPMYAVSNLVAPK